MDSMSVYLRLLARDKKMRGVDCVSIPRVKMPCNSARVSWFDKEVLNIDVEKYDEEIECQGRICPHLDFVSTNVGNIHQQVEFLQARHAAI